VNGSLQDKNQATHAAPTPMSFNKALLFSELFSSKVVNLIMDIGRNRVKMWGWIHLTVITDQQWPLVNMRFAVQSITQILANLTKICINANTVSQTSTESDN
jgi:hypothetical protein